jgi:hypothetical protein
MFHPDIESLEIAPGAGPFRIKGSAYKGHLEYVERYVPGGVARMLEGFRDKRQAAYFEQPFTYSSFYDLFPLVAAGHVAGRQAGLSFTQFVRVRARYQAERDLEGIHRVLMSLATPYMAIDRLPNVLTQYMTPLGDSIVEHLSTGGVRMQRRQLPRIVARWFQLVFEAYTEVVLQRSGAKTVVVRSTVDEGDKPLMGYETIRYRCEALWT